MDSKNLTRSLLELVGLLQDVPEARLGGDLVGREDTHTEHRRVRVGLGRLLATNDLVLVQERRLHHNRTRTPASDYREQLPQIVKEKISRRQRASEPRQLSALGSKATASSQRIGSQRRAAGCYSSSALAQQQPSEELVRQRTGVAGIGSEATTAPCTEYPSHREPGAATPHSRSRELHDEMARSDATLLDDGDTRYDTMAGCEYCSEQEEEE